MQACRVSQERRASEGVARSRRRYATLLSPGSPGPFCLGTGASFITQPTGQQGTLSECTNVGRAHVWECSERSVVGESRG